MTELSFRRAADDDTGRMAPIRSFVLTRRRIRAQHPPNNDRFARTCHDATPLAAQLAQ